MQYPLRDEGGLGRLKSILSTSRSNFNDMEVMREFHAFHVMELGKIYTQTITKLFQWSQEQQEFQKKDDFKGGLSRSLWLDTAPDAY